MLQQTLTACSFVRGSSACVSQRGPAGCAGSGEPSARPAHSRQCGGVRTASRRGRQISPGEALGWEQGGAGVVSWLDQSSVMGTCSCTCSMFAMALCCCCVPALARAASTAPGQGPIPAPTARSQVWEHPPAPSQSLTCFWEVPDQPIPWPGHAERWEQASDHSLAHAVQPVAWGSPVCKVQGSPCTGHGGAESLLWGLQGRRQVPVRASLLSERPCFLSIPVL